MNYLENTFTKYTGKVKEYNIHPEIEPIIEKYSGNIEEFNNTIFYGPIGCGKYSQILNLIDKYSISNLKYNKKFCVQTEKDTTLMIHMSDIHYEVDIELLGCNSKCVFHSIYQQINDIICTNNKNIFAKNNKIGGIILCKNFHTIQNELLECFYTYMTSSYDNNVYFILHTEDIGFIPRHIIELSNVIKVIKPSKKNITNTIVSPSVKRKFDGKCINLKDTEYGNNLNIYNNFINRYIAVVEEKTNNVQEIRNIIYDILTYNVSFIKFIYHLLNKLESEKIVYLNEKLILSLFNFFSLYDKHYRPVFHLEKLLVNLLLIANEN
jgi:hypothetical protein